MRKSVFISAAVITVLMFSGCGIIPQSMNSADTETQETGSVKKDETGREPAPIIVGAENTEAYLPLLEGRRVGLTANATSVAFGEHDLDFLLGNGVDVTKVYAPEHGFRGDGGAGEAIDDTVDEQTGIPIISIYGDNKKPSSKQLDGIDVMVYDIQDVGARFFTYISTMHYVMEACAQNDIPVIVLDRPNPNIDYVAGPIRDDDAVSFVSMDPIPMVYGMTCGELAQMINGEGWLENGAECDLTVIPVENYTRGTEYRLPVNPSPSLQSYNAVRLYPSLCLFEATVISVGRGADDPFTAVGYPDEDFGEYVFTPEVIPRIAPDPLHKGRDCYGMDLSGVNPSRTKFTIEYFLEIYRICRENGVEMINNRSWLKLLWGNDELYTMVTNGGTEEEIEQSYAEDVRGFMSQRRPYLIYKN